jgi:hypothetical protein
MGAVCKVKGLGADFVFCFLQHLLFVTYTPMPLPLTANLNIPITLQFCTRNAFVRLVRLFFLRSYHR